MGFRQGAYARVFTYDAGEKYGTANVSVSRKNKTTNEYEVEFQDGYVRFVGEAHNKAVALGLPTKENYNNKTDKGVSIKINSCDVTNKYDVEKKKLYINYVVFDFDVPDNNTDGGTNKADAATNTKTSKASKKSKKEAESEVLADDELPF